MFLCFYVFGNAPMTSQKKLGEIKLVPYNKPHNRHHPKKMFLKVLLCICVFVFESKKSQPRAGAYSERPFFLIAETVVCTSYSGARSFG
jgi:hypothetical protein